MGVHSPSIWFFAAGTAIDPESRNIDSSTHGHQGGSIRGSPPVSEWRQSHDHYSEAPARKRISRHVKPCNHLVRYSRCTFFNSTMCKSRCHLIANSKLDSSTRSCSASQKCQSRRIWHLVVRANLVGDARVHGHRSALPGRHRTFGARTASKRMH
jgi:hypothetical protein